MHTGAFQQPAMGKGQNDQQLFLSEGLARGEDIGTTVKDNGANLRYVTYLEPRGTGRSIVVVQLSRCERDQGTIAQRSISELIAANAGAVGGKAVQGNAVKIGEVAQVEQRCEQSQSVESGTLSADSITGVLRSRQDRRNSTTQALVEQQGGDSVIEGTLHPSKHQLAGVPSFLTVHGV